MTPRLPRAAAALFALAAWSAAPPAKADFAVLVSPPRLELKAKPGERLRQVIELTHTGAGSSVLQVRSADWQLRPDDLTVDFFDELQPGSCRPWVAIERREVTLTSNQPYRFRLEVTVPADAQAGECRFALLFEGKETVLAGPNRSVPVAGRIGVITYVGVGDVAPDLQLVGSVVRPRQGRPTPMLQVRNTGTAHGRLDGFLRGRDAKGDAYEVGVTTGPILPGETRAVDLLVTRPGEPDDPVTPAWPLQVTGKLELGGRKTVDLDLRIAP